MAIEKQYKKSTKFIGYTSVQYSTVYNLRNFYMAQIENLNLELKSMFSFPLISWAIQVQILNPGTDLETTG